MRTRVLLTVTASVVATVASAPAPIAEDVAPPPAAPSEAPPTSAGSQVTPSTAGSGAPHRGYGPPTFLFGLTDDETYEPSGVVASSLVDEVLFTHNDSPTARHLQPPLDQMPWPFASDLYAVGTDGTLLATYHLVGAANRDWEDIARGPGLDGATSALWLADIGDNNRVWRDGVTAYVLPEPTVDAASPGQLVDVGPETYDRVQLTYPDGPHDAEAFLVHPTTGQLAIVTKEAGTEQVFVGPDVLQPWPAANELTLVATFHLTPPDGVEDPRNSYGLVTGADWSPDGSRLAITTYRDVYEYDAVGTDIAATITAGPRLRMELPPAAAMSQVEAIGYTRDGRDLVVMSEDGDNSVARRPAYVFRERAESD